MLAKVWLRVLPLPSWMFRRACKRRSGAPDGEFIRTFIRTAFWFPGTLLVAEAGLSVDEQWNREVAKRYVEHGRDRERFSHGATLGPITYMETRGVSWQDWRGEFRSEVIGG